MTHNTDPIKTIEEIVPCTTGCGSNADPADGFGYCTCGAEEQRKAINNELSRAENRGRTDELVKLSEWGKTIDDQWNAHFKDRLAQLKQSQTEGGE